MKKKLLALIPIAMAISACGSSMVVDYWNRYETRQEFDADLIRYGKEKEGQLLPKWEGTEKTSGIELVYYLSGLCADQHRPREYTDRCPNLKNIASSTIFLLGKPCRLGFKCLFPKEFPQSFKVCAQWNESSWTVDRLFTMERCLPEYGDFGPREWKTFGYQTGDHDIFASHYVEFQTQEGKPFAAIAYSKNASEETMEEWTKAFSDHFSNLFGI